MSDVSSRPSRRSGPRGSSSAPPDAPLQPDRKGVGPFRTPVRVIRANLRAYLALNAAVYGLVAAGFALALVFPALGAWRRSILDANGTTDLVVSLLETPWLFALTILGVNTLTVGAAQILLPSMVVPFAGVAVFAYRAFVIGLALAPANRIGWIALIPHSLTILIEFQAYVLLVLGAHLIGRSWLRPSTVGAENRRQGYVRGLKLAGWVSLPALGLLVIGAFYEAYSLRYLVPILLRQLL